MLRPKFISLDNSSWVAITRGEDSADRILATFATGLVVPFFTSLHLWEFFQHADDSLFSRRIDLLRRLPFVAFPRCIYGSDSPGNIIDLEELEMACLRDSPTSTCEEIVSATQPHVPAGFCSGAQFCTANEERWRIQRIVLPEMHAESIEIASLAHFPIPGVNLRDRVPLDASNLKTKTPGEVAEFYGGAFDWLVDKLKKDGDPRINGAQNRFRSAESAAARFLKEAHDDAVATLDKPGDILENLLAESGVDRARLPNRPTIEDVGYEFQFIGHLKIHERRLKLPPGTLKQIARQENVPSWLVWREVDRAVKRLQKAEGSSLFDKMIVPFGLYLDGLEVDKRTMDCVRQAFRTHPLFSRLQPRIFRKGNLSDVARKLESLVSS
jgi:hypothetical protein